MSYDPTSTEGVPEHGRERLKRLREQPRFFTSDLSVNVACSALLANPTHPG